MVALLKFIFIAFLIIYLLGYIGRYLLSRWLKKFQQGAQGQATQGGKSQKEGEVTINNNPTEKKHFSKDDGEYVDYEEIK